MRIHTDPIYKVLYATDASAYREIPRGVAFPSSAGEIAELLELVRRDRTCVIPRTAGTSLAGQVVGNGVVADVSRYMNRIIEIDPRQRWARVEPGVILDVLNREAAPYGLFFGPETSTSSRCCLGGMVGNNSCGSHSLVYGSTRDHLLEAKVILSDGSRALFSRERAVEMLERIRRRGGDFPVSKSGGTIFRRHREGNRTEPDREERPGIMPEKPTLEEKIYTQLYRMASDSVLLERIEREYPDREVRRRNCGYALDLFLQAAARWIRSGEAGSDLNLCTLLAGSEGTLAFAYELKLNLVPLSLPEKAVVCAHCASLPDVFLANLTALRHRPEAVELMDSNILELSKSNIEQNRNRFFVKGDPAAILIVELAARTREELDAAADALERDLADPAERRRVAVRLREKMNDHTGGFECCAAAAGFEESEDLPLAYECSRVYGKEIARVWALRKAGLGLLSGMKGDAKPVSVIEDTAVAPYRLPAYMADFRGMLRELGLNCVYHAHIGTGELHLRPILNLKDASDRKLFREVARRTALLVKKHKGSLSGEHGDGRLRGEFIPLMYGEEIYRILKEVKKCWDPDALLNAGKIIDTPPMDTSLRYDAGQQYPPVKACFNYEASGGLFCAVEQCNGSGDCRRPSGLDGILCPSFRQGGEEFFSTRARANLLREFYTHPGTLRREEVLEVLDLCLSCKACRAECPSNVDMTRFKAEFLQQYYDEKGIPFRSFVIARMADIQRAGSIVPRIYNFFASGALSSSLLKKILKFSADRSIPSVSRCTFRRWNSRRVPESSGTFPGERPRRRVYLFVDEFTNYMEAELGMTFVRLLERLGYEAVVPYHGESGRAAISKGVLRRAKKLALKNVLALKDKISEQTPLVGIEPSCILSFRDEYPDLVPPEYRAEALRLGKNALLFDEFIVREMDAGRIGPDAFTKASAKVYLHGHCHQKAWVGTEASARILQLPEHYRVEVIPSGCCGMAGSFGYEKEHRDFSMAVGEQILFPAVRRAEEEKRRDGPEVIVAAPGTSCRQQILDGTGIRAYHPVEILYRALKSVPGEDRTVSVGGKTGGGVLRTGQTIKP